MPDPIISLTDNPEPELRERISAGLRAHNTAAAGFTDSRPLAVAVRDPATGELVGGLSGRTSLGLLFIDLFFLPDAMRGAGLGRRIIAMAEEEAIRRGCSAAVLWTISFQAPEFYLKQGYSVLGEVASGPPGTRRVFLTKRFD